MVDQLQHCSSPLSVRLIELLLGAVTLLLVVDGYWRFRRIDGDKNPAIHEEKQKIIRSTVAAAATLLWPLLWNTTIGYGILVHHPLTAFGFFWPMITSLLDMAYVTADRGAPSPRAFSFASVRGDANALIGVAFAIGTLLMATKQVRSFIEATSPLLMYALLLLIAFVVPTPNLDEEGYLGTTVSAVQKAFFNYAMGFIITAITLNLSPTTGLSIKETLLKVCQ